MYHIVPVQGSLPISYNFPLWPRRHGTDLTPTVDRVPAPLSSTSDTNCPQRPAALSALAMTSLDHRNNRTAHALITAAQWDMGQVRVTGSVYVTDTAVCQLTRVTCIHPLHDATLVLLVRKMTGWKKKWQNKLSRLFMALCIFALAITQS